MGAFEAQRIAIQQAVMIEELQRENKHLKDELEATRARKGKRSTENGPLAMTLKRQRKN